MPLTTGHVAARAACLLALIALGGCGAGAVPSTPVASVAGGGSVDRASLEHWAAIELATIDHAHGSAQAISDALELLIAWQWTLADARRNKMAIDDGKAATQLTISLANTNEGSEIETFPGERELRPYLTSVRTSQSDRLLLVRMAMLAARVRLQQTRVLEPSINDRAVYAYYRDHLALFTVGERRDIKAIMNRSLAKVVEAKHEMQAGVKFGLIEKRFNQSVEGGLRLGRGRGSQGKQYERDYFSAPLHRLVGPRKEILYYVFEVFRIRPEYVRPLGEVEASIRKHLARLQLERDAATRTAYWRSRTSCRTGYRARRCGS